MRKNHHGGNIDNGRLRPLVEIFDKVNGSITTLEIDEALRKRGVYNMAVSTSISDLRKNGYPVSRAVFAGKSTLGAKVYSYRKLRPSETFTYKDGE